MEIRLFTIVTTLKVFVVHARRARDPPSEQMACYYLPRSLLARGLATPNPPGGGPMRGGAQLASLSSNATAAGTSSLSAASNSCQEWRITSSGSGLAQRWCRDAMRLE